jgi:hypothetical protein
VRQLCKPLQRGGAERARTLEFAAAGLALRLHRYRGGADVVPEGTPRMRKILALLTLLLLAIVHAPTHAQALVSSFFPDIFPLATSEPALLLLTGLALLSLAAVGSTRHR